MVGSATGVVRIADNDLIDNFRGIFAADTSVQILRNSVVGTGPRAAVGAGNDGDGILCRSVDSLAASVCVITGNTVRSFAGVGILTMLVSGGVVVDNVVDTTGERGLNLRYTSRSDARSNTIRRAGLENPGHYFNPGGEPQLRRQPGDGKLHQPRNGGEGGDWRPGRLRRQHRLQQRGGPVRKRPSSVPPPDYPGG
jgi:Right handed beta helix region